MCRSQLLEALIGLFELPEDDELPAGEHFIEVDDTGEFAITSHLRIFIKLFAIYS